MTTPLTAGAFKQWLADRMIPDAAELRVDAFGGMRGGKTLVDASVGFDWDSGTVVLHPATPLTVYVPPPKLPPGTPLKYGAVAFTKVALPFGWLSCMSPHTVYHAGRHWRTAEHLFQALRFCGPDGVFDDAAATAIAAEASPMAAKFAAKKLHAVRAEAVRVVPCTDEDVANMELVLRKKLAQHPHLGAELRATDRYDVVEDVTSRKRAGNHRFWGAALVDGLWRGENTLGKIWVKLRTELREHRFDAKEYLK